MNKPGLLLATLALIGAAANLQSQEWLDRLPLELLDVASPTTRVSGTPGTLQIVQRSCNTLPTEGVRRRIVNTAIQEWAFFGFGVQDQTVERDNSFRSSGPEATGTPIATRTRTRGRGPRTLTADLNQRSDDEVLQVALSVGGYWTATPDGPWMLERQNERWLSELGVRSDWRDFWSAAFISWVMCEAGLGDKDQFQRSIAHHDYIDQAILARDGKAPGAAYVAYDVGEVEVSAGDLLCRGSRPEYTSIAARRAQLEIGARSHCDIVVKVDREAGEIWAIGGNVSDSVRLKKLPAGTGDNGVLRTLPYNGRMIFAHLKLQADPIEANAIDNSPTMASVRCIMPNQPQFVVAGIAPLGEGSC